MHKTCLYILGYITYVFVRGVDALKGNFLKKGPVLNRSKTVCHRLAMIRQTCDWEIRCILKQLKQKTLLIRIYLFTAVRVGLSGHGTTAFATL